ncbi:AAA domain-containing protein [archaeon]|nr:AAA domain-containing protein [archaeon]
MEKCMEYSDLLSKFEVFFSEVCYDELLKAVQESEPVIVDFEDLERFDSELADSLLSDPDEAFQAIDEAIVNVDIGETIDSKIYVRFKNTPDSNIIAIKNIRSKHIKKYISIEGIIKQASEVRPEITLATFECKACGERINIIQEEQHLEKPYMCACGNKQGFSMVARRMVDLQRLEVEESPDRLDGGSQARKIAAFLQEDLVDPKFQKKVIPGAKVRIYGVVRDIPLKVEKGKETKRRDLFIESNYLETIEQEFADLDITEEDEKEIKKLSTNPKIYELLTQSIAPSIYGYEKIKESIALQLFGGVRKIREDGVTTRGDIHILLIGDPGAGKSQLLKYVSGLAPKARYVVGKSTSGAGLTATVVKDEFMRGWALEAGALVLANKGIAMIDELDKMSKEDRSAMHEVMEQQTVTISKANVQATLNAQTTILGAANPKFGRFDPYTSVPDQIDLPDSLISRFDLMFIIRDVPNKESDTRLVKHILKLHENPESQKPPIPADLLRKFIAYAKINIKPVLTEAAQKEIEKFYVSLRNQHSGDEQSAVPIGARQLEAIIRLSEASAKVRLGDKVLKKDAKKAISLLMEYMMAVGIDPETGQLDMDRIESGTTTSQRNKIRLLLKVISEMQEESKDKTVLIEDVIAAAEEQGIDDAEGIISKLKREGELFEPKNGHIRKV